jgi:hypothetical protein
VAWTLVAVTVIGACEPTQPPAFARRSSAPATVRPTAAPTGGASAGASAGASQAPSEGPVAHPSGSPSVAIEGNTITVLGKGDKNTAVFPLDGNYTFVTTACPGTGVIPFIWVYEEFGQSRGTYVAAEFTVKNLKGNFYLRISSAPTCEWTTVLTKE